MQMINHGLITGALFILVGCVYTRVHKRNMSELGGLAKVAPRWAGFFVFFCLAGLGLPGLNGFVSELLTIYGTLISARVQWGGFFWPGGHRTFRLVPVDHGHEGVLRRNEASNNCFG